MGSKESCEYLEKPQRFHMVRQEFLDILNDLEAGAMLSYLMCKCELYAKAAALEYGEWFYITVDKVASELKLKRRPQERALGILKSRGFVSIRLCGKPCKRYFRIEYAAIAEAVQAWAQEQETGTKHRANSYELAPRIEALRNTPSLSKKDEPSLSKKDEPSLSKKDEHIIYEGAIIPNGELYTNPKAPILRIGREPQIGFPLNASLSAEKGTGIPTLEPVEEIPPVTLQQNQHPQEMEALPAPATKEGTMQSPLDDLLGPAPAPSQSSAIPATGKKARCAPMPAHPAIGFLQELAVILRPILVDKADHRTIPNPGEPAFKYQSRALVEYDALESGSWASRKLQEPGAYLTPSPENKRHFERLKRARTWVGNTSLMQHQLKTIAQLMVDTRSKSDKFAPFDSVADFLGIEGRDGWFAPWWTYLDAIDTKKAVEMVQKAEEAVLKDARAVRTLLRAEEWGDIIQGSDNHARFVKIVGREPAKFREEIKKC